MNSIQIIRNSHLSRVKATSDIKKLISLQIKNQQAKLSSKCKVKLVVCRNQQKHHNFPTRATTLGIMFLHVLLSIAAKFNLKTLQLNAVNAFVHTNLNKIVFMHILSRYNKNKKVFHLNWVFYSLQWLLLLWQQKLTNKMKKLGSKELFQKPCIVLKNRIIKFFYVDDIIFAYKKNISDKFK